jgi:hypothetical protein
MPLWDKTSSKPKNLTRAEKRDVIATDVGFVRRQVKGTRVIDEVLVSLDGVANSTNFGEPTIDDMYHSTDTVVANTTVTTYVVFDEPITPNAAAKIDIANTVAGEAVVGVANTTLYHAQNAIAFTWTPTVAGTYKVQAQTVANNTSTALNFTSKNAGNEVASLVISGPVSNTAGLVIVTEE